MKFLLILYMIFNIQFSQLYPMTGIVTDINYKENIVTIEDFSGNLWEFSDTEDWMINDICSCIMNDNGTKSIYDDFIVTVRYNGWIE